MENSFGVVRVVNLSRDAKDISALPGVVLDVVISALICKLSEFGFLRGELLVEVEQVQSWRRQVFDAGKKYSSLKIRHWSFKLRRNERYWFVLDPKCLVELNGLRNEVCVELVQVVVEKRCEILGQVIRFLEARPESVGKCCDIGNVHVFIDLGFFLDMTLELSISVRVEQPLEHSLLNLLIVFFLEKVIVEEFD